MTRNIKVLGLAVFAVMAFSAFAASAAQAALFHGKSGAETKLTVTPDGTGTTAHQVFDAAGASITCPNVDGSAVIGAAETPETITTTKVEYTVSGSTCKFVGQLATVKMNGCNYKFTAAAPGVSGGVGVVCPAGSSIEFSVPSPACTVVVPQAGNTALTGATYKNVGSEVTVEAHVAGITYTATGAGCPTPGTQSNGNYTTGNFFVTGEASGTMTTVKVE